MTSADRRANPSQSERDRLAVTVMAVIVVLITAYIIYSAYTIHLNTTYLTNLATVSKSRTGTFSTIIQKLQEICQAVGCKVVVVK